mgnify:CR=1 FL=1
MNFLDWTFLLANLATIGTLIAAIFYARRFDVKSKKRENEILKEKEWQVVWADNFLKKAIEFNDTLSSSLVKANLGNQLKDHKDAPSLIDKSVHDLYKLYELEWDIKNYNLFIPDNSKKIELTNLQSNLMKFLTKIHSSTGITVDLEIFRRNQFEYSKLIREIHSELLEIKPIQKEFDFYNINPN